MAQVIIIDIALTGVEKTVIHGSDFDELEDKLMDIFWATATEDLCIGVENAWIHHVWPENESRPMGVTTSKGFKFCLPAGINALVEIEYVP